jgi:hypothetical protein
MAEYCENSKAYRLIDPRNPRKVQRERNVRFIEDHRCITRDQELTFLEEQQQENTEMIRSRSNVRTPDYNC